MSQETVLVVDDEDHVADLYAGWLQPDYEVRTAYSGEEALEKYDDDVDIVLLDRRMRLSGDEVLSKLRDRGFAGSVALVTAVNPEFEIIDMDFNAYVTKPVTKSDLRAVVDQLSSLSTYQGDIQEYYHLASKKGALEATKSERELADSDEYIQLEQEIVRVREDLDDTLADLDEAQFQALIEDLPTTD